MENKAARRYLRRVKRALPRGRIRVQLSRRACGMVAGYVQENPAAQSGDLSAAFGDPRDFAREMLSTLDAQTVDRARKRQRRLRWCVAAALALVLVAAIGFFVRRAVLRSIFPEEDGFSTVVEDAQYITKEEFDALVQAAQQQEADQ